MESRECNQRRYYTGDVKVIENILDVNFVLHCTWKLHTFFNALYYRTYKKIKENNYSSVKCFNVS